MDRQILSSILKRLENCILNNTFEKLETEVIELKDLSTKGNWISLKETVCAFLNSHSGIIITGINENEKDKQYSFTGYNEKNEQNYLDLRNAFADDNHNKIDVIDNINFEIKNFLDGRLKIIYVDTLSDDIKYVFYNNVAYERKSTADIVVRKEKIEEHKIYKSEELLSRREITPIKDSSVKDLSIPKLNDYIQSLNKDVKVQNLFADNDVEGIRSFLYKKYFIYKDNITTLGMLICGNDPGQYLGFRCEVDCYVDSKHLITKNKRVFIDTVINLLEDSFRFVNNNIEVGVSADKSGEKVQEYPREVIRESLNNSLAHRDYSINKNVSISIRPNKEIEIKNPGRFRDRILIRSEENQIPIRRVIPGNTNTQNPRLAQILKVFDKYEGKGYGMATLVNHCLDDKIDVPYYKISLEEIALVIPKGNLVDERHKFWLKSFKKYVKNQLGSDLTAEQEKMLVYLYKSEILNQSDKYTLLLTTDNDSFNTLKSLLPSGLIYKSSASHPLYPIYLVDRILARQSYDADLINLFGADYDFLPPYYKKALNIIYRYSKFNNEPITAKAVADELYREENGEASYTTFIRKISSYCSKMSSSNMNMLIKFKGYMINFNYQIKESLF